MRLIVLAAGTGSRLAPLTDDRPKCLVELNGRPLLEWTLNAAEVIGVDEVVVMGGYRAEQLSRYDVTLLINTDFAVTNMVHTLFLASEYFGDGFIMSYGDIVYAPSVLKKIKEAPEGVNVAIDLDWYEYWKRRFENPLDDAETLKMSGAGAIIDIGNPPATIDEVEAQYIGLVSFRGAGVGILENTIAAARADDAAGRNPFGSSRPLKAIYITDLLQGMISLGQRVNAVPINGQWVEIDTLSDLSVAERLIEQGRLHTPSLGEAM